METWNTLSLEDINQLDFPSPTGFMKVGDFLPHVLEEVRADVSGQYAILRKSLTDKGQLAPLHLSRDGKRLRDGIHRIAIATDLGWSHMKVSVNRVVPQWNNSEEGQYYWKLWNWRLHGLR